MVDPSLHGVAISPQRRNRELTAPAIIREWPHRRAMHLPAVAPAQKLASNLVMTVAEDIGFYHDRLSNNTLDGEPSAVDFRRDPLNHDPATSVRRLFPHLPQRFPLRCQLGLP